MKYSIKQIRTVLENKNYKFFDQGNYNLNIIGVRSHNMISDNFDDHLYLIFRKPGKKDFVIKEYKITTDPGYAVIDEQPKNSKGIAILVPGQYRSKYTIREHKDQYLALCQKFGTHLPVWRIPKGKRKIKIRAEIFYDGTGINIHKASKHRVSKKVHKWSAGCQVFPSKKDFYDFMTYCYKAESIWKNSFTYTLLDADDFKKNHK